MSKFTVPIVQVAIEPHPNADKLELAKFGEWQVVVGKGEYQTHDLAIFIPPESVLTERLIRDLGVEKFYSKKVRATKLRGVVSHGILMKYREQWELSELGKDVKDLLGIVKYEEPIPVVVKGNQLPKEEQNPRFYQYTNIENYKNYPDVFKDGEEVVITEKIHGTNFRASRIDGMLYVGSHKTTIKCDENNVYWRAARQIEADRLEEGEQIFGEIYGPGIQDLTYGIKPGEIGVVVFDAMKHGKYLDRVEMFQYLDYKKFPKPPLDWYGNFDRTLTELAGNMAVSDIGGGLREGMVITPLVESTYDVRGVSRRKIIKVISDSYLMRKNGTEKH